MSTHSVRTIRGARDIRGVIGLAIILTLAGATTPASAAFHLWQVREIYSNSSGSVQFVELADSFPGETATSGFTLTANSDGNLKTFTFPSNLSGSTPGSLLIATTGFGSLPGGVPPDFTFSQGGVSGQFFNPNATSLSFTYNGSGDSMAFPGATLPKDGVHSLTDAGAVGSPPGTPSISSGVNSPTNLSGQSGSVPEPAAAFLYALAGAILLPFRRSARRSVREESASA
jgi:hypothetical protein